ncbi:hypothetical protein D3874_26625 [Oleomonas cavernae]|uniref:Uncharacterized protein n=1 Tax=Oleomonas cavernae TaxID=2320859 RepID=A0A418VU53_9PROT|nr:hypothetical protein [Oleomonas cavernae]RJF80676.1 hypothetical protein D3874_26625 [Oleomonas cavernae]
MTRRAIVHIGWPRTGTTSFQFLLDRLRPTLAEAGVLYPDLTPDKAPRPHLSHQHLGETLDGRHPRTTREELLGKLDAALAATRCDVALLSYEGLAQLRRAGPVAEMLAALFERRGFSLEIMATVKPQDAFLNSAYTWRCQFLREARSFAPYARAELGNRRLDYAAVLAPWRVAAAGRVLVVPVRDRRSDESLVWRLFDALGLLDRVRGSLSDGDLARRENSSPGPVAVAASRWLHRQGVASVLGADARSAGRYLEVAAQARGRDAATFCGLTPPLAARLEARFAAANDAFAEQVWGCPWAARVAPEPAREANEILAADPDVTAVVDATLRQFGLSRRGGPPAWLGRRWRRDPA